MLLNQRVFLSMLALLLIVFTYELIRRRKLREEYAILWLTTGAVIFVFVLFPGMLYRLSVLLKLHHLTALLMVCFFFLVGIVLHLSLVISRLTHSSTVLTQELTLCRWELEELGRRIASRENE